MALEHIDPYPWFLNKNLDLIVNEQIVHTRMHAYEWADHWRPFLARLYDLIIGHFPKRFLIAIAGPPGSGKSVLAEQLHWIIDKGFLHKDAHVAALPMDGFHFPNSYLQNHIRRLPDGSEIPLSYVKGHIDTIDVNRLHRYIQALIQRPEYLPWPGYSRINHDVLPDKYKVHSSINIVIIEGNYLLLNRGAFAGIPDLFHLRLYIDCPAPKIIANLVERHIIGGKTIDEAKDWVKRIDLPNARVAETTKHVADVVFERDTENDIASVSWKGDASPTNASATAASTTNAATPSVSPPAPAPATDPAAQPHHPPRPDLPPAPHHSFPHHDQPQAGAG